MTAGVLERPIFLVGAERSGTTLLRLMLDHHPEICWCNEFEYAVDRIAPNGEFPQLEDYHQWLETDRIFQENTKFTVDPKLDYPHLVDSFLRQLLVLRGKPIVGATVHRHYDLLLHVWPDAKFIKIVRDGRDVARSCIGMNWAGNVWTGVDRWIEAEELWVSLAQSLPEDRYLEVRYEEDAIVRPEATLKRICEFIGVTYDAAMLSYPEDTTYSLPDPTLVYQWKKKLSEREIQLLEARIGNMLAERGYELSGLPILEVSPQEARKLRQQGYWLKVRERIRRRGFFLLAMDYIARRLHLKSLERYTTKQLNRKVQAELK